MAQPLSKTDRATNKMNNKKQPERKPRFYMMDLQNYTDEFLIQIVKWQNKIIVSKDAQKDLFVKKLKEEFLVGDDYDINDIEEGINKLNKEVFGDDN